MGDDLDPPRVIVLWCDGSRGLYTRPNVWHDGISPVAEVFRWDRPGIVPDDPMQCIVEE
ncbi:MAG: hypothetical protein VX249_10210 [Pseudomonadota bacterium]|nr:hypothetical protein [Pseudomonadota bacterium]